MLEISALKSAVLYVPKTGLLFWKAKDGGGKETKRWNTRYAGKPAFGSVSSCGYLTGRIDGKHIKAHRAAWAIENGCWPDKMIDHINGNRTDNRYCNLREATSAENAQNSKTRKGGTSSYRGVSRDGGKWRAMINSEGTRLRLGAFASEVEAALAYDLAAPIVHGEFCRTNFSKDRDAMTAFIEDYVRRNHKSAAIDGVRVWTEKEAF